MFNNLYDKTANVDAFKDNPKVFKPEDFDVRIVEVMTGLLLVLVDLPDEHEGSLVYCKHYIFAYMINDDGKHSVAYFTVEDSGMGNFLCYISEDGKRHNFGKVFALEDALGEVISILVGDESET